MEDIVREKAKVAFQQGVRSAEYQLLFWSWIAELCEREQARPPVENLITRNGIQFKLQSVKGRDYRYVPLDKWVEADFAYNPEPLQEKILSEIRIQAKALEEAKILEPDISSIDPDSLGSEDD